MDNEHFALADALFAGALDDARAYRAERYSERAASEATQATAS